MAKGRLIYNKISMSEQVNQLPNDTARLLFTWILTHLDVDGRFYGDAQRVKSRVFPCRPELENGEIEKYLVAMEELGLIGRYKAEGQRFLFSPKWLLHQTLRPEREADSIIPPPSDKDVEQVLSKCGLKEDELRYIFKLRIREDKVKESPFGLLARYERHIGYDFPIRAGKPPGKELRAAKDLLASGYTVEQVCGCHDWMREAQDWAKNQPISLQSILKQISFYVKKNPKTTKQVLDNIEEL